MSTVKATYTGFVGHEGIPVPLTEGEEHDSGHPLVQARPELFTKPVPEPKRPVLRGKGKAPAKAEDPPADPVPGKGKATGG